MTQDMEFSPTKWWQTGIIYQIYPLTFADGNGDGKGDLQGIIQKLDYLNDGNPESNHSLGIDAIWLSPIHESPMVDNGYDVSDYYRIAPVFGTLQDFEELLAEAHKRGIKVIMDLVINHTSTQHDWFLESSSSRDNPKSDWYLWQDPAPGGGVPNNWLSYFGGSGWTFHETRGQYYYHTFNQNQPDLNWQNPEVRKAIYEVIEFWLQKGVDGFRLDASSVYSKDPYFRPNPTKFGASDRNAYNNQHHIYNKNLPENHQIVKEIREICDRYKNRVLIGETFIDNQLFDSASFYGVNNDELHLAFNFEFPFSTWYPGYLQREIEKKELITPPQAWPTYFLDNHDIPRHLSRWVECSLCIDSQEIALAAATILLTVRGTPVLYYGEEIGMVNNVDIPEEKAQDKVLAPHIGGEFLPSRDGARTPMQWDTSAHAGFSFGRDIEPWLPVHKNYPQVNVSTQWQDPNSTLNFYRKLIEIRKHSEALIRGRWRSLIHYPYEHLAYVRETRQERVLVVINFSYEKDLTTDEHIVPKVWEVLLSNRLESRQTIKLPKRLEPFEIFIVKADLS
jgi:alpha-glucosidase